MEQTKGMGLDVDLISDMQKTSMPPNFHDLQVGPHTTLRLDSVSKGPRTELDSGKCNSTGAGLRSEARSREGNGGRLADSAENRKVSLVLDGKTVETREVNVPANGQGTARILVV